ncbi:uncharacterized protein P174DRAFT_245230 [Aspergillus novofumigatus IBT 16806]|uniref:Uncharacterized protein n=1 Tax=Aspergillus novofumigatus (strain IBT 16806) TaxID=1392255 RepID=A0A2I1C249_ASPN1|nr:uncharacterized protein P174DRAFT_245230 [Aspergillus novofumigatus IBT 16806]PKX91663.1 hypothetical protein P174DRAFT_245230 [Aspergillus novofumigatus IBT 16806]
MSPDDAPATSSFDTFDLPTFSQRTPRLQSSQTTSLQIYKFLTMSSIAAMASRRAFARQSLFRAAPRRNYSSKLEEATLDKAPSATPSSTYGSLAELRSTDWTPR